MTTYELVYQGYNLAGSLGSKAFYLIRVISLFKMLIYFLLKMLLTSLNLIYSLLRSLKFTQSLYLFLIYSENL